MFFATQQCKYFIAINVILYAKEGPNGRNQVFLVEHP